MFKQESYKSDSDSTSLNKMSFKNLICHQDTSSRAMFDETKPKITSLPSFSELLTSIPLPFDIKSSRSNSSSSSSSSSCGNGSYSFSSAYTLNQQQQRNNRLSSIASPPYNYYTQHSILNRMSTPPSQQSPQQFSPKAPVVFSQVNSSEDSFATPVPLTVNHDPATTHAQTNFNPITPVMNTFDTKIRSNSSAAILQSTCSSTMTSPHLTQHRQQSVALPTSPRSHFVTGSSDAMSKSPRDPRRKHICKVCSRSFTTSGHLARHNKIHTGERKHECPWPSCDARFARQDNCMQHYKTHTNGKNKRARSTSGASVVNTNTRNNNNNNSNNTNGVGSAGYSPAILPPHLRNLHQGNMDGPAVAIGMPVMSSLPHHQAAPPPNLNYIRKSYV
ncbi:NRG1 [Candida oxycetoniae]|uniref:NRG1 n=1 Tax=Candida oxycetoniae TaxID=497107 RepID=A0AAI9WYF5_9ASCO|nr:NRG1 [Candida oxycetoniae]KAI3405089.2 NRG1 [Candida oxycetoniae]